MVGGTEGLRDGGPLDVSSSRKAALKRHLRRWMDRQRPTFRTRSIDLQRCQKGESEVG